MKRWFVNIAMITTLMLLGNFQSENFAQQNHYGIRTGINETHKNEIAVIAYEIYLHTIPPLYSLLDIDTSLFHMEYELAVGMIGDSENSSLLISMGPIFDLINYERILYANVGLKPSLMTNHSFKRLDLGGVFNFKSHVALTVVLDDKVNLGYRFEHISNAGLYDENPGINLHYVEVIYVL